LFRFAGELEAAIPLPQTTSAGPFTISTGKAAAANVVLAAARGLG